MTTTMPSFAPRFSASKAAPAVYRAMVAFDDAVELDERLHDLVRVRASQINGCAYCLDMHYRDARRNGEDERRLATLAGWHESTFFTDRERAALALTDAVTRIADGGVSDAVWATAAEHFPEAELSQLLWAIVAINAWNRIGVATRMVPAS